MSNRSGGYFRKDGTYVSPDGYGRKHNKRGGKNGSGNGFEGIILTVAFFVLLMIINKCST